MTTVEVAITEHSIWIDKHTEIMEAIDKRFVEHTEDIRVASARVDVDLREHVRASKMRSRALASRPWRRHFEKQLVYLMATFGIIPSKGDASAQRLRAHHGGGPCGAWGNRNRSCTHTGRQG